MLRKLYISIIFLFLAASAWAKTPVEDVVNRYTDMKGVRHLTAKGAKMNMVRPILRTYPLGPLADDVQYLIVLKLEKASVADRKIFEKDLLTALKQYEYCVTQEAQEGGMADVYIYRSQSGEIIEIVVYNPEKATLNSLQGKFPVEELLRLRQ